MRKLFTLLALGMMISFASQAQTFPESIDPGDYLPETVLSPQDPLSLQILFVGGSDIVQTRKGPAVAKQWHDFIGFTPCNENDDCAEGELGWVSVNHEMILADDRIGDGGGMTVFKVSRDPETDELQIVDQTLEDGRSGKFFNVDFVGTVGNTGMNCAGIVSLADGRIWTAEEWFRDDNGSLFGVSDSREGDVGIRDTSDFTVPATAIPGFAGETVPAVDNINYMVEIDPRKAEAIRKQYNWGRQAYEGGVIMPDNKTVYLGEDDRPGLFTRFIADTPGDFTQGTFSYYAWDEENEQGYWVDYPITNFEEATTLHAYNTVTNPAGRGSEFNSSLAIDLGGARPWRGENAACMFIRNEWVAADTVTGKVYWAETGNDAFWDEFGTFTPRSPEYQLDTISGLEPFNGKIGRYLLDAARMRFPELNNISNDSLRNWLVAGNNFRDPHGRILVYDPATQDVSVFLEGGPYPGDDGAQSDDILSYPETHFTNPDGVNFIYVGDKRYMVICEDLNGRSFNRVPAGVNNSTCELFLLDMDMEPKVENLIRIGQVPLGAEVTGVVPTSDGKTLLVNSQHPSKSNPFPYNNSLTYAINGFDKLQNVNGVGIKSISLYDAENDRSITGITDGAVFTFSNLSAALLSIEAVPEESATVSFELSGPLNQSKVEKIAPYALFGNEGADFEGATFAAGEYTLTITTEKEGRGTFETSISFTLIDQSATSAREAVVDLVVGETAQPEEMLILNNGNNRVEIETSGEVAIYDATGTLVETTKGTYQFAVPGLYFVRDAKGNTTRILVQE